MIELSEYIEQHSSQESEWLRRITHDTNTLLAFPHMLSGQVQGRFLAMLSGMIRPHRVLELGTFTGYSALCLAEGLAEDGTIDTVEKNDELEEMILNNFQLSPYADKIQLHIADAMQWLQQKAAEKQQYDLIFIDADKREYAEYYDAAMPLLKTGGYILADNTLWDGHIVDPRYDRDRQTQGVKKFNQKVAQDPRVEKVIVPMRDGLTIIRKLC